jgi:holo-ACP synthase/triphosphoribosyl-dephospho-CoA synthase
MQKRGGIELAAAVSEDLRAALARNPFPALSYAAELDRDFIRQNLSPGGCADLLAAAYFLHDWKDA